MKWKIVVAVVAVALLLPGITRGDVSIKFIGMDPSGQSGVDFSYQDSDGNAGGGQSNGGGIFKWEGADNYFFQKKTGANYTDHQFMSFCIQLNQGIDYNYRTYQVKDVADALPNTTQDSTKVAKAVESLRKLWGYKLSPNAPSPIDMDDAEQVGAMQLAIWEIAYDKDDFDFESGNLQVTDDDMGNSMVILATQYYEYSQDYDGALPVLRGLWNECKQNQLVALVPEPTSFLAWCMFGLVGLVTGRRWRHKTV